MLLESCRILSFRTRRVKRRWIEGTKEGRGKKLVLQKLQRRWKMNSLVLSSDLLVVIIVSWLLDDVFVRCVSLTLFFDEENPRALS